MQTLVVICMSFAKRQIVAIVATAMKTAVLTVPSLAILLVPQIAIHIAI